MEEFQGQHYELIRLSDADFDGMSLELWEAAPGDETMATGDVLIRADYLDATGEMTVTTYRDNLPTSLIDWFRVHAERALPPADTAAEPAAARRRRA